jgi:hypothetical protein
VGPWKKKGLISDIYHENLGRKEESNGIGGK